jgi:hypothetical protein
MSSVFRCERCFGPGVEAAVDDVGEVALERAACFSFRLTLGLFAGEEGAGAGVDAGLHDRDPVEGGVELAVAAAVEAVVAGGLAGAAGDRGDAAEAGEGGAAAEAADIGGVGDQRDGDGGAGAGEVGDRVAVLGEERGQLGVELGDSPVELLDLERELADAAAGGLRGQPVAEVDPLQLAQRAVAQLPRVASASGSACVQIARSRWIACVRS